ncbi:MBL fold metallo-hydrolase [Sphaerisporangium sp. NPDC088356]|uniref:MBL fold metallo-hydrolase n=1 Tax=Sphaerisporangium sp. NPDC088356 TaxID=3154871 RepID=UPI00343F3A8B
MTYTGDVTADGPADVRELPGLTISKIEVGDFGNNAYLLRCRETGDGVLVDAAADARRLLDLIGDRPISKIVTTHQHQDHWMALAEVAKATGAETVAHPLDAPGLPVPVTQPVEHGDKVTVGVVTLDVIHLRGHTPGSISLLYQDAHLFTGDSLFPGGVGNTQRDPARFEQLYTDVVARVFDRLPDETWVYPGHGKDTTLGAERPSLPEWRARGW